MTTSPTTRPARTQLPGGTEISRLVVGLWQVADIERSGTMMDPERAADALAGYAGAGFDSFDMADHYGSAEVITGALLRRYPASSRPTAFTKWCPPPGPMTAAIVRAGVQARLDRLGVDRVDLLQFHWWTYQHPAWLDALHQMAALQDEGLIGEIGVTNFDTAHLGLALADGVPVATNQVSFSLLDRRAAGDLSDLCMARGVRLLAYGTLCGGFLSERWLGAPEPLDIADWSKLKYKRFIDAGGGWAAFQRLLAAVSGIARRHGVSVSNVATAWVLGHRSVAAAIVGARLGEAEHRDDNLRAFDLRLDAADHAALDAAFAGMTPIPGDCGDEYRKPPYLTASGDLSHHRDTVPMASQAFPLTHRDGLRVSSGSRWEPVAGYSRAIRVGDTIRVSGTTATDGTDRVVAPGDAGAQTVYVLDKIAGALAAAGGRIEDVVRTRIYLRDPAACEAVAFAHGRVFGAIRPANTLVVAGLIGDCEVEIEAEAVVPPQVG